MLIVINGGDSFKYPTCIALDKSSWIPTFGASQLIKRALKELLGELCTFHSFIHSFYIFVKMDRIRSLSLLVVFSLLLVSYVSSETLAAESNDQPLIRQVVDGSGDGDLLLGAEHHFSLFKRRFGKSYASQEEHDYRFQIFNNNLRRAKRHQKLDPSATHGVTQFSDLTPREFRRTVLGLRGGLRLPSDANKAPILPTDNLPGDFDWRDHGAVGPVKNQVYFAYVILFLFVYIYLYMYVF